MIPESVSGYHHLDRQISQPSNVVHHLPDELNLKLSPLEATFKSTLVLNKHFRGKYVTKLNAFLFFFGELYIYVKGGVAETEGETEKSSIH